MTEELSWRVEETCRNAWPGLQEARLGGWLVRFGDGLSRRANSANPLFPDAAPLLPLIPECRALYRKRGRKSIFRIPSLVEPAVDEELALLGFTGEGETCVLYGAIDDIPAAPDPEIRLSAEPSEEWFAAMARLQGYGPKDADTYRKIVERIAIPACFASLAIDGEIVGLTLGTLHRGLLNYASVITDPRRRRSGFARRIMAVLALWASEDGATGACLEVEAENLPARTLYRAIGLKAELYRYHYRREPN